MARNSNLRRDSLDVTELARRAYGTPASAPNYSTIQMGDDSVTVLSPEDLQDLKDEAAQIRSRSNGPR